MEITIPQLICAYNNRSEYPNIYENVILSEETKITVYQFKTEALDKLFEQLKINMNSEDYCGEPFSLPKNFVISELSISSNLADVLETSLVKIEISGKIEILIDGYIEYVRFMFF